jgi:serine protease Do
VVSRDGKRESFDVVLDSLQPADEAALAATDEDPGQSNALGLAVESISAERRRELEAPEGGVIVSDIESDAAWRAGLRPGDIVLMINNQSIEGLADFNEVVEDIAPGKAVAIRVWREGASAFFAYTPGDEDLG